VSRFKVKNYNTWYVVDDVSTAEAERVGCPSATVKLISARGHGTTYGTMTGTRDFVRIPGASDGLRGLPRIFHGFDSGPMEGYYVL
jgi:hypothetical protein